MWDKIRSQFNRKNRSGELYYATHHHLIPLYVISGISLIVMLVLCCFVAVLWQNSEREFLRPGVELTVRTAYDTYIPITTAPVEKKQYVIDANVRFPILNPSNLLRYSYVPGIGQAKTSSSIILTTEQTLRDYARPLQDNPERAARLTSILQQCSRLYVIRFAPGVVPLGGFSPLQDVKLKDGRTAYVHKNATCVPGTTESMNRLDEVEKTVLAIESY